MKLYFADPDVTLYCADALTALRDLPDQSVHMACTSPPFFGLRDYQTEGQIGLESSPDEWASRLVDVFREVRRVLRDDGTLWVECGDSYANHPASAVNRNGLTGSLNAGRADFPVREGTRGHRQQQPSDCKPKDLIGQPWLLAFALRADGWYLRSCIVWHKPNAMPESVTDRPTSAHSYVFLLSKKPRYFYDAEALREPPNLATIAHRERYGGKLTQGKGVDSSRQDGDRPANGGIGHNPSGANARSVWTISNPGSDWVRLRPDLSASERASVLAALEARGL